VPPHKAVYTFADRKKKEGSEAVYTFADGKRERVRVVKAHSESDGGAFTVFIPSLQRERQTVQERLDFS
jgi:hypothetical protein